MIPFLDWSNCPFTYGLSYLFPEKDKIPTLSISGEPTSASGVRQREGPSISTQWFELEYNDTNRL